MTSSPATFLKEHEVIQPLDGAANSSAVKRTYKIKEALKREIEVLVNDQLNIKIKFIKKKYKFFKVNYNSFYEYKH